MQTLNYCYILLVGPRLLNSAVHLARLTRRTFYALGMIMSTSNMLWNMVKALYFFGCMTVACAQLSAAGSLAAAGGLSATNIPIGDELLETNTGGRLRHGHRLNRAGRRPRLHTNTSRSYKQLLSYVSNGLQGHLPKNTSDVPKCSCVMDGHEGDLNVAVLKITLVILGLWAISAGSPLYKGVYRSLKKGCRTCDVYLLVSGSFEFLLKLGNLPGHRLDYVFSATEGCGSPTLLDWYHAQFILVRP